MAQLRPEGASALPPHQGVARPRAAPIGPSAPQVLDRPSSHARLVRTRLPLLTVPAVSASVGLQRTSPSLRDPLPELIGNESEVQHRGLRSQAQGEPIAQHGSQRKKPAHTTAAALQGSSSRLPRDLLSVELTLPLCGSASARSRSARTAPLTGPQVPLQAAPESAATQLLSPRRVPSASGVVGPSVPGEPAAELLRVGHVRRGRRPRIVRGIAPIGAAGTTPVHGQLARTPDRQLQARIGYARAYA